MIYVFFGLGHHPRPPRLAPQPPPRRGVHPHPRIACASLQPWSDAVVRRPPWATCRAQHTACQKDDYNLATPGTGLAPDLVLSVEHLWGTANLPSIMQAARASMRMTALPVRATLRTVATRPLVARATPLVQKSALVSQPLVRLNGQRFPLAIGPSLHAASLERHRWQRGAVYSTAPPPGARHQTVVPSH